MTVFRALTLTIAALLSLSPASTLAKDVMIVGWEESPPYQFQTEDGQLSGLDIDVITAVLKHAGYKIQFKSIPWKRILNTSLKSGEIDIALSATKTPAREKFAYFSSTAYAPWDSILFIHKSKQKQFENIKTLSDISHHNITLGVSRGSIYSEEYERLLNNPEFKSKLYFSAKEENALKMLLSGRVDAILASGIGTLNAIKNQPVEDSIHLHIYLSNDTHDSGSHFMLSKKSVTLNDLNRINQSLIELKNNHTIDRLLNKYLPTPKQVNINTED